MSKTSIAVLVSLSGHEDRDAFIHGLLPSMIATHNIDRSVSLHYYIGITNPADHDRLMQQFTATARSCPLVRLGSILVEDEKARGWNALAQLALNDSVDYFMAVRPHAKFLTFAWADRLIATLSQSQAIPQLGVTGPKNISHTSSTDSNHGAFVSSTHFKIFNQFIAHDEVDDWIFQVYGPELDFSCEDVLIRLDGNPPGAVTACGDAHDAIINQGKELVNRYCDAFVPEFPKSAASPTVPEPTSISPLPTDTPISTAVAIPTMTTPTKHVFKQMTSHLIACERQLGGLVLDGINKMLTGVKSKF